MYKIAICDDEPICRTMVAEQINRIITFDRVEIIEYADGRDLLCDIRDDIYFDIIVLDISMNYMDGVETAREIRENTICSKSIIFFVTSYEADITQIVDVNPLAYIYKPVTSEEMEKKLGKALKILQDMNKVLEFISDRTLVRVKIDDIMYIESYARGVIIHTQEGSYKTATYKIGDIGDAIRMSTFIRCHNSFIVNKNFVRRMAVGDIILYSGKTIPVSRKYQAELLDSRKE